MDKHPGSPLGALAAKPAQDASANARPVRRLRLTWHLAIVLIVKVILLTLLWHAFIKPNKVAVDADRMGNRITGTLSQTQGENK